MNLNRGESGPLYLKLKNEIIKKIQSGELKAGGLIKTENELCSEYSMSRYPVRQALGELVDEGYLQRVRGKGTFVSNVLPVNYQKKDTKVLGLILTHLAVGFNSQILVGFEKQARKRGYLVAASSSEDLPEEELKSIDEMIKSGVNSIFVFPCGDSRVKDKFYELRENNVLLGLIDRDPGIPEADYVGSDNQGGAYSAVRHMAIQGFRNTVFISDMQDVSSVNERLEGYIKAVEDFGLNPLTNINIKEDVSKYYRHTHRLFLESLQEELVELKKYTPFGIFAANDYMALQCMKIIEAEGLEIGKDIAVVGFDNVIEGEYTKVPLTTIAQNGLLLGQSAANIAIDKLEEHTNRVYRSIIPTQLIVRKSC